jgi:hypothetical protein
MDEARLAEIEAEERALASISEGRDVVFDLITEVRRLKKAVDQAYSDGESNREADIVCILGEAEDDTDAMIQIKHAVGWED